MLSVLDYCLDIQTRLRKIAPDKKSDLFRDWFRDTGKIAIAVSYAMEGKNSRALKIAEKVADDYIIFED